MDCLFCKFASKEIPNSNIFYEDEAAMAFLDIHPLTKGHAMVIPKEHAQNILDLPENMVGPVFLAVKEVTALLQASFSPDGFTIGINQGRISGQAIDHLHVHIIPRYNGDGGKSIHSIVSAPPLESLEEIRSQIVRSTQK